MSDLTELLERVEKATGPDRELDFALCKGLGTIPIEAEWKPPEEEGLRLWSQYIGEWELPSYTLAQRTWREKFRAFVGTPEYYADKDGKWVDDNPSPSESIDWKDAPASGSVPRLTGSIDATIVIVEQVLPGWAWKCGTCCVSDDAWLAPDFNSPIHGERLKAEFPNLIAGSPWDTGFDVDRRPPGNVPLAILAALLRALIAQQSGDGK